MFTDRAIYGIHEVAEELGIERTAASQRKRRGRLPEPTEELAAGPVWFAETLREFFEGGKK